MNSQDSAGIAKFIDLVHARDMLQAKFVDETVSRLKSGEIAEFDSYLRYCFASGDSLPALADAYLNLVDSVMEEQFYFAKTGKYRYSKLAEVESKVYADPAYMHAYMHGIAISLYLWPQHLEIRRFFQANFPASKGGSYLEVGPGHGMFFLHALRQNAFSRHVGVDISVCPKITFTSDFPICLCVLCPGKHRCKL